MAGGYKAVKHSSSLIQTPITLLRIGLLTAAILSTPQIMTISAYSEVLDLETGAVTRLTDDTGVYTDPVFSPDGSRIAYVSTNPNGYFNLFVREFKDGEWAGEAVVLFRQLTTEATGSILVIGICTSVRRGFRTEKNSSSSQTGMSPWDRVMCFAFLPLKTGLPQQQRCSRSDTISDAT